MSIVLFCPKCKKRCRANIEAVPLVRCPHCGQPLTEENEDEA